MRRTWRPTVVFVAALGVLMFGLLTQAHSATQTTARPKAAATVCGGGDTPLVTTCVNPGGDVISTCPTGGPNLAKNTCATLIFPPGPGGAVTVAEERQGILACQVPLTPCLGSDVFDSLPPGYTDSSNPVVLDIFYDVSQLPTGNANLLMQKLGLTTPVLPCLLPPNRVFPCLAAKGRVSGRDYRFVVLQLSGDPKFQGIAGLR